MILVLASEHDRPARALANALPEGALSGAEDLSAPGWLHRVGGHGPEFAVAGGVRVDRSRIDAVVVRRPYVAPEELRWIRPADRCYVAAEATAFLRSWLAASPCRVINRPTATSLGGPSWRPLQWQAAALRAGIPAAGTVRGTGRPVGALASVLVIGQTTLGGPGTEDAVAARLSAMALALAREASTDLLEVVFEASPDGPRFARANPWPDVLAPPAVETLRDLLAAERSLVPS